MNFYIKENLIWRFIFIDFINKLWYYIDINSKKEKKHIKYTKTRQKEKMQNGIYKWEIRRIWKIHKK